MYGENGSWGNVCMKDWVYGEWVYEYECCTVEKSSIAAAFFSTLVRHHASWQLDVGPRQKP